MTGAHRNQENDHTAAAKRSRKSDGLSPDDHGRAARRASTVGEGVTPPSFEVDSLRWNLFALYRESSRFQGLIRQDLRPVWLKAYRGPGGEQLLWALLESISTLDQRTADWRSWQSFWDHPATVDYIGLLHIVGPLALHLSDPETGHTPYWLVPWIHSEIATPELQRNDIAPLNINEGLVQGLLPWQGLTVRLHVTADSVMLDLDGADNILIGPKPAGFTYGLDVETRRCTPSHGVLYDEEHWRRLHEASVSMLKYGLDAMRTDMGYRYPRRRPSTVLRNRKNLSSLFLWLYHGTRPIDRANRQRLRRLSRLLGIAPPQQNPQAHVSIPWDIDGVSPQETGR
jgi:hypothetical protein